MSSAVDFRLDCLQPNGAKALPKPPHHHTTAPSVGLLLFLKQPSPGANLGATFSFQRFLLFWKNTSTVEDAMDTVGG